MITSIATHAKAQETAQRIRAGHDVSLQSNHHFPMVRAGTGAIRQQNHTHDPMKAAR